MMETKEQICERVKLLKRFYMNLINYGVFNTIFILIWFVFDRDNVFWPKYVLLIWGISLIFKAYRLGLVSLLSSYTTFLTPEWEAQKVQELMKKEKKSSPHKVPLKRDVPKKAPTPQK